MRTKLHSSQKSIGVKYHDEFQIFKSDRALNIVMIMTAGVQCPEWPRTACSAPAGSNKMFYLEGGLYTE